MLPIEHDGFRFAQEASGTGHERAQSDWVVAPGPTSRRTGWTYLVNAAVSPSNLFLFISVMFLSLILWSGLVLVLGLGLEVAVLAVVQRCASLRRGVDERLDEAERAQRQRAREALTLQMGQAHRQELAKIETLLDKTFLNAQHRDGGARRAAAEPPSTSRLIDSYIRLATAHRACEGSLATIDHQELAGTIRSLEAAALAMGEPREHSVAGLSVTTSPERSRTLVRRRLSIADRRAECWARTQEGLDALRQQIAAITEFVDLMHEESLIPTTEGSEDVLVEVDDALAELEHGESALRELADIRTCSV
jgi:hypothetical protein